MTLRRILLALLTLSLRTAGVSACSYFPPPVDHFDPLFYVFTGRVVGYVVDSRLKSEPDLKLVPFADSLYQLRATSWQPGWGAVVEAVEVVQAPKRRDRYVVFPAGLTGDCRPEYRTRERVEEAYPFGDTVAVVSEGETDWEGQPWGFSIGEQRGLPLIDWISGGSVSRRALPTAAGFAPWPSSPDSAASLDAFRRRYAEHYTRWERLRQAADETPDSLSDAAEEHAERVRREMDAYGERLHFEFRGDLARLERESSLSERAALLAKMRRYWWGLRSDHAFECSFTTLVHTYLPNAEDRISLSRTLRAARLKPAASSSGCLTSERLRELAAERGR